MSDSYVHNQLRRMADRVLVVVLLRFCILPVFRVLVMITMSSLDNTMLSLDQEDRKVKARCAYAVTLSTTHSFQFECSVEVILFLRFIALLLSEDATERMQRNAFNLCAQYENCVLSVAECQLEKQSLIMWKTRDWPMGRAADLQGRRFNAVLSYDNECEIPTSYQSRNSRQKFDSNRISLHWINAFLTNSNGLMKSSLIHWDIHWLRFHRVYAESQEMAC